MSNKKDKVVPAYEVTKVMLPGGYQYSKYIPHPVSFKVIRQAQSSRSQSSRSHSSYRASEVKQSDKKASALPKTVPLVPKASVLAPVIPQKRVLGSVAPKQAFVFKSALPSVSSPSATVPLTQVFDPSQFSTPSAILAELGTSVPNFVNSNNVADSASDIRSAFLQRLTTAMQGTAVSFPTDFMAQGSSDATVNSLFYWNSNYQDKVEKLYGIINKAFNGNNMDNYYYLYYRYLRLITDRYFSQTPVGSRLSEMSSDDVDSMYRDLRKHWYDHYLNYHRTTDDQKIKAVRDSWTGISNKVRTIMDKLNALPSVTLPALLNNLDASLNSLEELLLDLNNFANVCDTLDPQIFGENRGSIQTRLDALNELLFNVPSDPANLTADLTSSSTVSLLYCALRMAVQVIRKLQKAQNSSHFAKDIIGDYKTQLDQLTALNNKLKDFTAAYKNTSNAVSTIAGVKVIVKNLKDVLNTDIAVSPNFLAVVDTAKWDSAPPKLADLKLVDEKNQPIKYQLANFSVNDFPEVMRNTPQFLLHRSYGTLSAYLITLVNANAYQEIFADNVCTLLNIIEGVGVSGSNMQSVSGTPSQFTVNDSTTDPTQLSGDKNILTYHVSVALDADPREPLPNPNLYGAKYKLIATSNLILFSILYERNKLQQNLNGQYMTTLSDFDFPDIYTPTYIINANNPDSTFVVNVLQQLLAFWNTTSTSAIDTLFAQTSLNSSQLQSALYTVLYQSYLYDEKYLDEANTMSVCINPLTQVAVSSSVQAVSSSVQTLADSLQAHLTSLALNIDQALQSS